MYLTRSEYDRDVNTFSRDGRLFQVEYAIEAIRLGSTAVGVRSSEGVVLAVEKRVTSPLMEMSSIEKILEVRCVFLSPCRLAHAPVSRNRLTRTLGAPCRD
jgi:20S proteasome subunit alpha 5